MAQQHDRSQCSDLPDPVPCRLCGRKILWAVNSETGKRVPLDPRPTGFYRFVEGVSNTVHYFPQKTFISHFLTCPKVGTLTRKGQKGGTQ